MPPGPRSDWLSGRTRSGAPNVGFNASPRTNHGDTHLLVLDAGDESIQVGLTGINLAQPEQHPVRGTWRLVSAHTESWQWERLSANARYFWTRLHSLVVLPRDVWVKVRQGIRHWAFTRAEHFHMCTNTCTYNDSSYAKLYAALIANRPPSMH